MYVPAQNVLVDQHVGISASTLQPVCMKHAVSQARCFNNKYTVL